MKNTWLAFISIGFLTVITFIFFFLRTQPIKMPVIDEKTNESIDQPTITFVNPSKGPETAKVTIVEYGDFQCESCVDMDASLETVRQQFPDDVRIVWKDFPNESLHPESTSAAVAAHCADRQGTFWEYHDLLLANQSSLSTETYQQFAKELNLDTKRFNDCVDSKDTLAIVQKDFEEAKALELSATPATYINTKLYVGAVTTTELISYVTSLLP